MGLPNCTMVVMLGYPCPTCGMTTAFSHVVRGQFIDAFKAQPAGLIFALAVIATVPVSLSVVVTGKVWMVNWHRTSPAKLAVIAVLILLGGWVYKVLAGILSGTLPIGR